MSGLDGPTSELREWLTYLREIGVRDLRAPVRAAKPAPPKRKVPPAPAAPPKRTTSPARKPPPAPAPALGLSSGFDTPPPDDPAKALVDLRNEIGDCTRCKLHEQRKNIVFGVGDPKARLMFVGEGPGADEDAKGEPFVGRAGRKLDEMIVAIGLRREDVYIANVVKCRPPKNRDPERDEVETCSPFLLRQIEAIRPRVIVTLGSPATKCLLGTRVGITRLRGNWQEFRGIPVMPTFHPAYLLRSYTVQNRRMVWEDLKAARERVDEDP